MQTIDTIINSKRWKGKIVSFASFTQYIIAISCIDLEKKKKKEKWTKNSRNHYFEIKDYERLISMFRPNYSVVTFTSIIWIIKSNIWTEFIIF